MLLPKQIWKDIAGYEGLYQVSNTGKVRSLDRVITYKNGRQVFYKSKILKQYLGKDGYMYVHLYKDKKNKRCAVHRLVAQAFLENPNNWPQVNHKDENKQNNCSWNLEYCTCEYNMNYGTIKHRISEAMKGNNNPNAKPVLMFTKEGEFIRRFDSVADATEYCTNKNRHGNIAMCARGEQKTAYGYIWKYEVAVG